MDTLTAQFVKSLQAIPQESSLFLKSKISNLLNIQLSPDQSFKFPGSQPVSLEKTGLAQIIQSEFKVCEKTDGTRFLLFIDLQDLEISQDIFQLLQQKKTTAVKFYAYFIDREYNFFQVKIDLNLSALVSYFQLQLKKFNSHLFAKISALFDGEIVQDMVEQQKQLSFYLFDTLYFGKSYMNEFLEKRLEKCKLFKKGKFIYISNITIQTKSFFDKTEIGEVLALQKRLPHNSDGIIFTKEKAAYFPGTTQNIQKWKPINQNTVDLQVETGQTISIVDNQIQTIKYAKLYVANRGILEPREIEAAGTMYLSDESFAKLQKREKPIILEVFWDKAKRVTDYVEQGEKEGYKVLQKIERIGGWSSQKYRTDKTLPNDRRVYNSVMKAYQDFIDIQDIMLIIAGKKAIPGVCTQESPFILKKLGNLKFKTADEEFAV